MAFVILPCDMPWWEKLQNRIKKLAVLRNVDELVNEMQIIHNMCYVSLDPVEETNDSNSNQVLSGLKSFFEQDLSEEQRNHFFDITLPVIANSALSLQVLKPSAGLRFSLQQEASELEISRHFARSLIAHSFLSTFPKRTNKTHPTLQDFNFFTFFRYLDKKCQKCKLLSIFHYFDMQNENKDDTEGIKISRQIMKNGANEYLTMEDWLESNSPLCHLLIKHDNRMESAEPLNSMFVCFASKKLGGHVLNDGHSRECIQFVTCPELLVTLLCVEALQDNEVVIVENLVQTGKINNMKLRSDFEPLWNTNRLNVCVMDAADYTTLPLHQYEEVNVLRELNKTLLGFCQKSVQTLLHRGVRHQTSVMHKRLSPIGESVSTTPTLHCDLIINRVNEEVKEKREFVGRKQFFIGSSDDNYDNDDNDDYSTCLSDFPEQFYSTNTSLRGWESSSDEEEKVRRYSGQLDTVEHRNSFAERLREALCRAQSTDSTSEGDSSYAVDISVTGSSIADGNGIRMKRGGSRGFMLDDSLDINYQSDSFENHSWQNTGVGNKENLFGNKRTEFKRNKGDSSKYSFSTDYTMSDLEDVYDELNRWLEEPPPTVEGSSNIANTTKYPQRHTSSILAENNNNRRKDVVLRFANSLLKRALSETFVGIPLTEDGSVRSCDSNEECDDEFSKCIRSQNDNIILRITNKSSSFDVDKNAKHKLSSAQLISASAAARFFDDNETRNKDGLMAIVTGNWGCGSRNRGDVQLKFLIQWLAGSVVGVPRIIYYTANHPELSKLDTVCRLLVDRQWNVGELISAIIYYMNIVLVHRSKGQVQRSKNDKLNLFDLLITSDRKILNIRKTFSQ